MQRRNRNKQQGPVDGNAIARDMCEGPLFSKYHEWARYGCLKLVSEQLAVTLGPLDGTRQVGERINLLQHKQKVSRLVRWSPKYLGFCVFLVTVVPARWCVQACVQAGACEDTSPLLFNPLPPKTRCQACKAIVADVERQVALYNKPKRADVADVVERLCDDVSLRHEYPAFLQEVCQDLVDELQVRTWGGLTPRGGELRVWWPSCHTKHDCGCLSVVPRGGAGLCWTLTGR